MRAARSAVRTAAVRAAAVRTAAVRAAAVFGRSALFAALALGTLASCGEEPPPEGYEIRMRFVSVDPTVINQVRVTFDPSDGERFMFVEPMSFEDGAIDIEVASDGVLVLTLAGAHVAANAPADGSGGFVYPLEVWTPDTRARAPAPAMRIVAMRAGEAIAEGFLFLPEWPLPLGGNVLVPVTCLADAASRGRCRP